jgi:hypothetical protein
VVEYDEAGIDLPTAIGRKFYLLLVRIWNQTAHLSGVMAIRRASSTMMMARPKFSAVAYFWNAEHEEQQVAVTDPSIKMIIDDVFIYLV